MKEAEEICPGNQAEWRSWLELNHVATDAVWLIFHKKGTAGYNLSWSEAVDEALCFGWIDSTKKRIDHDRFKQYFTKRKPKSTWSKVNKDKVSVLIEQGLMRPAGYASIEVAKANGSWTLLDSVENLEVPKDLEHELGTRNGAMAYFDSLSKSARKTLLYWIASAKRDQTKHQRIKEVAENAAFGRLPKRFR